MSVIRRILRKVFRTKTPRQVVIPADIPDDIANVWRRVAHDGLTYLSDAKMESLVRCCQDIERRQASGVLIEAGCAWGGSSILMCAAKSPQRTLRVYDVFGMIPPPGKDDGPDVHERYETIQSGKSKGIGGRRYYGYEKDLYERVKASFQRLGFPPEENHVALIPGLVQDTLVVDEPVCLAHIDVDWYDPVRCCLERIVPRLAPEGVLILDDYNYWSGCRKAVDEYFDHTGRDAFTFDDTPGHLVVRRKS